MKKIISFIILAVLSIAVNARTFVLITGVSNYEGTVNDLQQSTKDAKSFYELMSKHTNDVTILTSKNAYRKNVLDKLSTIARAAKTGDCIMLYYSGHGTPGAICLYDEFLGYSDIVNIMKQSKASQKVLIVDACHAGTVNDDISQHNITERDGLVCIMGCRPEEYSQENSYLGAGYLTQGLLKALRGKGDTNRDRRITVLEAFKYAYSDVVKRSQNMQHPQLIAPQSFHNAVLLKW